MSKLNDLVKKHTQFFVGLTLLLASITSIVIVFTSSDVTRFMFKYPESLSSELATTSFFRIIIKPLTSETAKQATQYISANTDSYTKDVQDTLTNFVTSNITDYNKLKLKSISRSFTDSSVFRFSFEENDTSTEVVAVVKFEENVCVDITLSSESNVLNGGLKS